MKSDGLTRRQWLALAGAAAGAGLATMPGLGGVLRAAGQRGAGPVTFPQGAVIRTLIGDLPPEIRRAYGFEWSDRDARALDRWSRRVRAWSGVAPAALRRWRLARRAESMGRAVRPMT